MIKVAAGDNYRQQAKEKDVYGRGRTAVPSHGFLTAVLSGSKSWQLQWGLVMLFIFRRFFFFQLAVLTAPVDHYWFPPLLEEPRHFVRAKLGQKAEDPGQPLNKGWLVAGNALHGQEPHSSDAGDQLQRYQAARSDAAGTCNSASGGGLRWPRVG